MADNLGLASVSIISSDTSIRAVPIGSCRFPGDGNDMVVNTLNTEACIMISLLTRLKGALEHIRDEESNRNRDRALSGSPLLVLRRSEEVIVPLS